MNPDEIHRVREIVRQAGVEFFTVGGGSIDIGNLPTQTARELESYVKSRSALRKKQIQKKALKKRPSFLQKNDLAPAPLTQSRLTLTTHVSRELKPVQGHLPIFADTTPSYPIVIPVVDNKALSNEKSNSSSSFYSGIFNLQDSDED